MKNIFFSTVLIILLAGSLYAGGLYGSAQTLFSDHRAHAVGDIITIEIVEISQASNEAATELKKEQQAGLDVSQGAGPLDFIPLTGLSTSNSNDYSGEGKTSRKGNLKAKITAVIMEVLPNGNLLIEGSRVVEINGEQQLTVLTGIIRPQDITPGNSVYSYNIANAQITYKGKGTIDTSQRPGFFAKLINWIF